MSTTTLKKNSSKSAHSLGRPGVVTLADVARRAAVDSSTVSRVLNGAPGAALKPETRRRIQQAARELGYAPNAAARTLAKGRTNVIGVVCYNIMDPLVPPFLNAVEAEAESQGYRLFICTNHHGPMEEAAEGNAYISLLHERRVDAILVFGERIIEAEGYLKDCPEVSFAVATGITGKGTVCTANVDYFGAGMEVGEHLASLGHREVAFLSGPHSSKSVERRQAGLREGLKKHGATLVTIGEDLVSLSDRAGHQCIITLLASHSKVTAAVSRNDEMAFGAMRALYEAGVRVPDQFSLVSWGDAHFASLACPALTAVNTPIREVGRDLMMKLIEALKSSSVMPAHITLPMELKIRESTGPARSGTEA